MISGTLILLVLWTVKEEDPIWVITMFRRIYHCRGGKVDRLREFVQAFLAVTHRLVYQVVPVAVVQPLGGGHLRLRGGYIKRDISAGTFL